MVTDTPFMQRVINLGGARLKLLDAGVADVGTVFLRFSAGDSDIILGGKRREAVFYVDTKGRAMTGVVCGDGYVRVQPGW